MPNRASDLLQRQARALGDPTRHEIFRRIEEAEQAPGVRELADGLGLHQSAVRQHLAKLMAAELVSELPQPPAGPGRPRSVYRRAAGVVGVWTTENPFERLAALLVDAVRTGASPREAGRDAGRSVGVSQAAAQTNGPALAVLTGLMASHGFDPTLEQVGEEQEMVLGRCPFASLATVAPDVVCELHHGLAEGIADVVPAGDPVEVTGLVRVDPLRGGCRLQLRPREVSTENTRQTS